MKIFTVAAGLAAGRDHADAEALLREGHRCPSTTSSSATRIPRTGSRISQVLAVSSNICAAKIGLEPRRRQALRRRCGASASARRPGCRCRAKSAGTLAPARAPWVQVETAAAAFGQGISVTNLQLAMAIAAIANGGELMEPILVKKVTTATGELVREAAPRVRRRVVPRARRARDGRDAGGGDRRRGHRRRGGHRRLPGRRQDRDRAEDRSGHRALLARQVHRVVRRLRAGGEAGGRDRGHARRADGRARRRRGRRADLPPRRRR